VADRSARAENQRRTEAIDREVKALRQGGMRVGATGAWLRDHAHEHPGCWLAVVDGTLVGAAPEISEVVAALKEHPRGGDALLHFEPIRPE